MTGNASQDRSADGWHDGSTPALGERGQLKLATRRAQTGYERLLKPVFDRVLGIVLLVLLSWLLLGVALVVRLQLGAGVIYRQERIGRNGRTFAMLKFRTMEHDRRRSTDGSASDDRRLMTDRRVGERRLQLVPIDGPERRLQDDRRIGERRGIDWGRRQTHKTPNDPRHTPLGRFLRRYSLDELPQLLNVVRGDLSLVGPRPELPEVVATYEPWQHARHQVKPGLTGLWQVTERQQHQPMHLHVDTDLSYIDRLSLQTDLQILLRTPLVVLGRGQGI